MQTTASLLHQYSRTYKGTRIARRLRKRVRRRARNGDVLARNFLGMSLAHWGRGAKTVRARVAEFMAFV